MRYYLDSAPVIYLIEQVPVTPLHERDDGRPEVEPLLREEELVARRVLAVAATLEDAVRGELVESCREHVARDAEVALQVLEAPDAEEDVADDEEGPPLPHELERAGDRTDLGVIAGREHHERV